MKYAASFLIATVFLSPLIVAAQSTTTATSSQRSRSRGAFRNYRDDGSSQASSTRQAEIRTYRQQSNDIQQKINTLSTVADQIVLMPVLFGVRVMDIFPNFGDPRSDGRSHEGEDILAVKGTPIVSPTNAVVIRTGVGTTEGNYVYTANPGGETFVYMHLDKIGEGVSEGVLLSQGALIGYVGDTGNALGGPAHLHFEIHNNSNTPVDPFPRLTGEVPLFQKIAYLSTILNQNADPLSLSILLVTHFRSTFLEALLGNIALPASIVSALATVPVNAATSNGTRVLPDGDLTLGSSGLAVITLQAYLIRAASGPAALALSKASATGAFGPITQRALIEFQTAARISPASGYYGPGTRAYVTAHPITAVPAQVAPGTPVPHVSVALARNLTQGSSGEDVRTLQRILNARGILVAVSGSGSPTNESTYFGPATKAAVIRFQISKGISPAAGYVGPLTRTALVSLP